MTSECHVCGGEENLNYVCPGIQCERAFCDDCLADLCPRVGKSRWKKMRADSKTFTCDCCAGYCPKCKPKDAKVNIRFHESLLRAQTAFDICKDVRVEFKKAWQKLKRYLEYRDAESEAWLKQQGLDRQESRAKESRQSSEDAWPREVALPPPKTIPHYVAYTPVSQGVTRQAEDQATFTYFPYVGDVADKKWVAELKELYEKGESLRANDLSHLENLVFAKLLPQHIATTDAVEFFCRVFANFTGRVVSTVLKWQDEQHPCKPDTESPSDNGLLFCHSQECFYYCCTTHGDALQRGETPVHPKPRPAPRLPEQRNKPCGERCYRTSARAPTEPYKWIKKDTVLVRRLVQQMGDDPCTISWLVQIPCDEVNILIKGLAPLEGSAPEPITEHIRKLQRPMAHKRALTAAAQQHTYERCKHPGKPCSADNENCHCITSNMFCEKWCTCDVDCPNRFPGCQCVAQGGACVRETCLCWQSYRECDPDLCNMCGANLRNVPQAQRPCQNVPMQSGYYKVCEIGQSRLHGYGLFIMESAEVNDFVFEYTGEVISESESERRGTAYDKLGHSFLFNLTDEFVIDATRKGNRTRFANHSKNPNIVTRTMWCNGSRRIGFYALRKVKAGEELFLDYHYDERFEQFVSRSIPAAAEAKSAATKKSKGAT